jgi:GNAT superfamily N-acetyltransferase
MSTILEVSRDGLTISTDPARLDSHAIHDMLSRAYWAQGRTLVTVERTLQHSLTFGVYDGQSQIGLARVVSDYATFAWLCDVFIHENYRGRGVGKWLMETLLKHPDLRDVRRFLLVTRDAHSLYSRYRFKALVSPEMWMERSDLDSER